MNQTLIAAALLALAADAAAAQTSWTWTGANGASGSGTHSCTTEAGQRDCTVTRTSTGAYGRTFETELQSATTYGNRTVTGSNTGPNGGSSTFTRTWSR